MTSESFSALEGCYLQDEEIWVNSRPETHLPGQKCIGHIDQGQIHSGVLSHLLELNSLCLATGSVLENLGAPETEQRDSKDC